MDEYIDREALEVALNHRLNFLMAENGEYDHYTSGFDEAVTRVENFPAADVATVRHGRWEFLGPNRLVRDCMCGTCSLCKVRCKYIVNRDICPNCGATMDLED